MNTKNTVVFLWASLLALVGASDMANLRGTSNGLEELLDKILAKMERQDELIESLNQRVAAQEEELAQLKSSPYNSRRLNATDYDDEDCYPVYNATLGYCVVSMPVLYQEDAIFAGEVTIEDDAFVFGELAVVDRAFFEADAFFEGETTFESSVLFEDSVSIDPSDGAVSPEFFVNVDAYFDNDVIFKDDTMFYDDVLIEGQDSHNRNEFVVGGYTDISFETDTTLVVDTESLFRNNVYVMCDEDDATSFDGRRALEEGEEEYHDGEEGGDRLSRGGLNKHRGLGYKSRKPCYKSKNAPTLFALEARIDEIQSDEVTIEEKLQVGDAHDDGEVHIYGPVNIMGTDGTLTADNIETTGTFTAAGGINTNGADIDTSDPAGGSGGSIILDGGTVNTGGGDVLTEGGDVNTDLAGGGAGGDIIADAVTAAGAVDGSTLAVGGTTVVDANLDVAARDVEATGCVTSGGGAAQLGATACS